MVAIGLAGAAAAKSLVLFLVLVTWAAASNDPASVLPKFGMPLYNLTVTAGREAIFVCVVENLGLYKVAWLRGDTQTILTISSHVITKNPRILVEHSGHREWSLHIKDTRESDRGWYMCQVNTEPMSHITGFLEIVVAPSILDERTSTDTMVLEGGNVTLRCAASGTPPPKLQWRREKDNIILSNLTAVPIVESPQLEITKVTRLQMGAYMCIASNGVQPSVSKRIVLIVHFPPMITIENQLIGAYEYQENVTLECRSQAFPTPITYWTTQDNTTISNAKGERYMVESIQSNYDTIMRLTLTMVRHQDFGSYRCVATNSLGASDGQIVLQRIASPPSVLSTSSQKKNKPSKKMLPEVADSSGSSPTSMVLVVPCWLYLLVGLRIIL